MTGRSWSGARPSGRATLAFARSAGVRRHVTGPAVVALLVVGQAREDGARNLVAILRLLEAPLLARVRHEADLDEDRRHGGPAEDVEACLLHTAVGDTKRLRH